MQPGSDASADEGLAELLAALGSAPRIALLRQIRTPRALREIELRGVGTREPAALREGAEPRPFSRQAVKVHLDRLAEIGVVVARDATRDYGPTVEYVVNHQRLFAIAEEVRELAKLRPVAEPMERTMIGAQPAPRYDFREPCLVLVKGLEEGRTFPLERPALGKAEWVIGRRRGLPVALDFDPYVSTENSAVSFDAGAFAVRDLPENRNGTFLNFRRLPPGGSHPLRTGDVIGVGRTLLLFRG